MAYFEVYLEITPVKSEGSRMRQRKKLNCSEVTKVNSANLSGMSEAEIFRDIPN